MDATSLLTLCQYNAYANNLVFDVAAKLTPEELQRHISPSHSSVYQLLTHLIETEAYFLALSKGETFVELQEDISLAELHTLAINLAQASAEFLTSINPNNLENQLEMSVRENHVHFTVGQAFVQTYLHATHHRGELSIVMSELGHPLPTLDILLQFIEASGQQWFPRNQ